MIVPETVQCDVCKAVKSDANSWLPWTIAARCMGTGSIGFFATRESFVDPVTGDLDGRFELSDLCSQECARIKLSRWFESLPHLAAAAATTATPESVTP